MEGGAKERVGKRESKADRYRERGIGKVKKTEQDEEERGREGRKKGSSSPIREDKFSIDFTCATQNK